MTNVLNINIDNEQKIISLLNEFSTIKTKLDGIYKVNLKPAQLKLLEEKKLMDEYDPKVLNKIEKLLSKISETNDFDSDSSLKIEGLNFENAMSARDFYSTYLENHQNYIEAESEVNKYSEKYKELKKQESSLLNELISIYKSVIKQYLDNKNIKAETYNICLQELEKTINKNYQDNISNINAKIIKSINNILEPNNVTVSPDTSTNISKQSIKKDKLIRNIISMLKTKMSITKLQDFLLLNKIESTEEEILNQIKDLEKILYLYSDTKPAQANKDIELVVNIHDIPVELAVYIYKNKTSINKSLLEFKKINNIK